jgi:hypothetical protein
MNWRFWHQLWQNLLREENSVLWGDSLLTVWLVRRQSRSKLVRGWRPLGNLSFKVIGENLFLLEFEYECDRIRVIEGRPWIFERSVLFAVEAV